MRLYQNHILSLSLFFVSSNLFADEPKVAIPRHYGPSKLIWENPGVALFADTVTGNVVRFRLSDLSSEVILENVRSETPVPGSNIDRIIDLGLDRIIALGVESNGTVWTSPTLTSNNLIDLTSHNLINSKSQRFNLEDQFSSGFSRPISTGILQLDESSAIYSSFVGFGVYSTGVFAFDPNQWPTEVVTISRHGESPSMNVGVGLSMHALADLESNPEGNLVVVDTCTRNLIRVDPSTGDRTLVSGSGFTGPTVGIGPPMVRPLGFSISDSGQIFVADAGLEAILRVNHDSGDRTIVSSSNRGTGISFIEPVDILIQENGFLIVSDPGLDALVRVEPSTGNRSILLQMDRTIDISDPSLTTLYLHNNDLTSLTLPEGLTNLITLDLSNNNLTSLTLPEGLTSLTKLILYNNDLTSLTLPEGLTSLTTLTLWNNDLTSLTLPEGLTSLTKLYLSNNGLTSLTLPEGLTSLTTLTLWNNDLTDFSFLESLTSLTSLNLQNNDLTSLTLPEGLTSLTKLNLSINDLTSLTLPEGLTNLTRLYLWKNDLTSLTLPEGLTNLITLDLSNNDLTSLTMPEGMNIDTISIIGFSKQNVTFYRPVIRIKDIDILSSGDFELTITGPQANFAVESGSDLDTWTEAGRFTIDEWRSTVVIPTQSEHGRRFFRVRELNN